MRDPKRIAEVIELVSKIWYTYPDLRLFQLLMAAMKYNGDPFYIEDDKLIEALKAFCEERGI